MHAAERGNCKIIELLLSHGALANTQDAHGNTALMYSASPSKYDNRLEICKLLIEKGKADPKIPNNNQQTALSIFVICNAMEAAQYLINEHQMQIDLQALMNCKTQKSLIIGGVQYQPNFSIQFLDFCKRNYGFSAKNHPILVAQMFIACAKQGDTHFLKRLLTTDCIPDVNSKDENGWTALMHATQKNYSDVIKILIEAFKVNPQEKNNAGQTAFDIAIEKAHIHAIDYFLKNNCGFTIESINQHGFTPLSQAAASSNLYLLEYFIDRHQANIHATDSSGRTALMIVASPHSNGIPCKTHECNPEDENNAYNRFGLVFRSQGHLDIVKYLISKGCNAQATDKNGRTALDHAKEAGRDEVFEYLRKH